MTERKASQEKGIVPLTERKAFRVVEVNRISWPSQMTIMMPRDLDILRVRKELRDRLGREPTASEISRAMHGRPAANRVEDSLRRQDQYPWIRKYVREVEKTRLFSSRTRERARELARLSKDVLRKAWQDGYYVGLKGARPFGWDLVPPHDLGERSGWVWDLERNATEFPIVKEIIDAYYLRGEGAWEIWQKLVKKGIHIYRDRVRNILFRNIRLHAGYVKYDKQWHVGRHADKAAVTENVWRTKIEPRLGASKPQYLTGRRVITGFVRKFDEWIHDTAQVEVIIAKSPIAVQIRKSTVEAEVKRAWKMRYEDESAGTISRATGFSKGTLMNMFRDPTYADKIKIAGKQPNEWSDAGVKPYVKFDDWLEIQKIHDSRPFRLIGKEFAKKRREVAASKIETFLRFHGPATTGEIAEGTSFSNANILWYLRGFLKGKVGREPKWFGRWYLLETVKDSEIDKTEPARDRILATLTEPSTLGEVAEKPGVSRDRVKYWLPKLIAQGLVEKRNEPGKRYPVYVKLVPQQVTE